MAKKKVVEPELKPAETQVLPEPQQVGFPGIPVEKKFVVAAEVRKYLDAMPLAQATVIKAGELTTILQQQFPNHKIEQTNVGQALSKWRGDHGLSRKSLKGGTVSTDGQGSLLTTGLPRGATMTAVPMAEVRAKLIAEALRAQRRVFAAITSQGHTVESFRATLAQVKHLEELAGGREALNAMLCDDDDTED